MSESTIDRTTPQGRWAFDEAVTAAFDDMLSRSIPQYEVMRSATFAVGSRFVVPGADVVDLGCSRGEGLAPFVERFGAQNRFVGVEVSPPMLAAARERFAAWAPSGVVEIRDCDLRRAYPPVSACLTLAVLTLQFTPIEHRSRIVREVYRHTRAGGALVLVEKVLGGSAEADALLVELYHALKAANGYAAEAIERKRLSLEGVLVPVTARWNEDLLTSAGFRHVECFWRYLNFAAWVAIREG
jgi:tRNA (cmo5U34)-methyltransferase